MHGAADDWCTHGWTHSICAPLYKASSKPPMYMPLLQASISSKLATERDWVTHAGVSLASD